MKQVKGFWLPDYEEHLVSFLMSGPIVHGGPTYQYHKLLPALRLLPAEKRKVAVDIGAHCGLWSRVLVHEFAKVYAFEPISLHRECFVKNVPNPERWTLFPFALGLKEGEVRLHTGHASSGDTYLAPDGEHKAQMTLLDNCLIPQNIDFLKIDCEGGEHDILLGGESTIRRSKPLIIVEQKKNKGSKYGLDDKAAVYLLESWGAKVLKEISGDYLMSWSAR